MFWLVLLLIAAFLCAAFCIGGIVLRVVYFLCIGLPLAIVLGVLSILLCITIIGIPLGVVLFKLAGSIIFIF